ncbi:hypothetical protein ABXT06_14285 [Flavobacterium sp. UW10123]|uniref:hypothetical protein n=1 Tax=Flavobacterium sp. UW10123 TaxID=3230800 RepID=UPI003392892F
MKKISLLALAICLTLVACNADENISQKNNALQNERATKEEESKNLEKLYAEIFELSNKNIECSGDWDFIDIGSQPCGGPEKYIPYSLKTNTTDFLSKVSTYNAKRKDFNEKWNISSTCLVVPKPIAAGCINGKPTLLYESDQIAEKQNLKKMYDEIVALSSNSASCSGNWHFVGIGAKPCGEPEKYIPYSLQINTVDFLAKVNTYNISKTEFNNKWKVNSTCDVLPKPESAKCIDGKATLLYESDRIAEKQNLVKLYEEIVELSGIKKSCTGSWDFIGIGAKPCGGIEKYIPYSLQIDTIDFLNKVRTYNTEQAEFNSKWDVSSACDIAPKPKSVECINDKATLVFK